MRIGVLDILRDSVAGGWIDRTYDLHFRRHYASIAPQAVSVWCRQLGHEVHYATYFGQGRPEALLPADLDVVFLSAYTQASAVAYALARLFGARGCRTVLGGPHATAFPTDSLRFFDLVVHDCDKEVIDRILRGDYPSGSVVSSGHLLEEVPSVEERLPEIKIAGYHRGRPMRLTNVALLASLGCPYRCNFCVDAKNDYVTLPRERLEADLRFTAEHLPGMIVSFHDPNFGVKFDEVLEVIEKVPKGRRNPYLMESSLSILRGPRLARLQETNCVYAAPGVESWTDYSNKAGVGHSVGRQKLESVVAHFEELHRYVPGLQANFILGTDLDAGREPVDLTLEFIRRLPFVWPTINIPIPFGGTELYEKHLAEGRILEAMPFAFYYAPTMVLRLRHYDPIEYYDLLIEIFAAASSGRMLMRRLASARTPGLRPLHTLRTLGLRNDLTALRRIRRRLASDRQLRAFHEGRSEELPGFYRRTLAAKLGAYGELLSQSDLKPRFDPPAPALRAAAPRLVRLGAA